MPAMQAIYANAFCPKFIRVIFLILIFMGLSKPYMHFKSRVLRNSIPLDMCDAKNFKELEEINLSKHLSRALIFASVLTIGVNTAQSDSGLERIITHKIFLDIKIANYTEESIGTNKGASGSGRLVIGLYGKLAPIAVDRFLKCIDGDGLTAPNYVGSQFSRIVDGQLLEMEKVRGINAIKIGGTEAIEFQGNILSEYSPIVESSGLRHDT